MRSNILTVAGLVLVLACIVLLGGWRIAVGVAGVALIVAGYNDWRDPIDVKPAGTSVRDGS